MAVPGRILVYGGRGSLGAVCVNHFKKAQWWVANIDFKPNQDADFNVVIPANGPWVVQEEYAVQRLGSVLNTERLKLDAIVCVTNGWTGGNATQCLSQQAEKTWKNSVWTSTIAATLATKYLKHDGIIVFSGSKPALKGTPSMIGYGMAKAAVHQLTKSLGGENSGLPRNATAIAVLPDIMDAETHTKWMPKEDVNVWTPLCFVANLVEKWACGKERPPSGSLVLLDAEKDADQQRPTLRLSLLPE